MNEKLPLTEPRRPAGMRCNSQNWEIDMNKAAVMRVVDKHTHRLQLDLCPALPLPMNAGFMSALSRPPLR